MTVATIARVVAAIWAVLAVISFGAGIRSLLEARQDESNAALFSFLKRVSPLSRWQGIAALLLVPLLFREFLQSAINTDLWPWSVAAWIALAFQLIGLRAYLSIASKLIERGVHRPFKRYVAAHAVLDLVVVVPAVAIALAGFG